ncbi:hypothetical protein [Streptomyces albidoflavus]|uniref:hypothetical protein n=1 Tax=Streptomyces albidoflavus TaxID=1886 RepID=UPI0033E60AE3|nr:hypothetical protein OG794_24800 [Streptomyces albidoflavus]
MQAPSSDPLGTPVPPAARSSLPWWALALPALAFAALLLLAFGPTAPSASAGLVLPQLLELVQQSLGHHPG